MIHPTFIMGFCSGDKPKTSMELAFVRSIHNLHVAIFSFKKIILRVPISTLARIRMKRMNDIRHLYHNFTR